MERLPSISNQRKDYSLIIFLIVSIGLHAGSIFVAAYYASQQKVEEPSTLEIEIEGKEDEPPPLGTNDTETGPPPAPEPEPTPPPIAEDTPPPPVVESDFDVPEENPTPTPAKPASTPKPKASPAKPGPTGTPSFNPNARPGAIKGVDAAHGGVAGGQGAVKSSGGKADFISTPNMQVPYNLRQRLAGARTSASASISYSGGTITNVSITKSSGNSSLDAAIIRHVKGSFRVKSGVSGRATLPIGIRL